MVDVEQIARLRQMRAYVDASCEIADAMGDHLLGALFCDLRHTLTDRLKALVSIDPEGQHEDPDLRFTIAKGFGREGSPASR